MTNRKLAYIVKDQKPLMLATHDTVQHACRCMRERRAGSVGAAAYESGKGSAHPHGPDETYPFGL